MSSHSSTSGGTKTVTVSQIEVQNLLRAILANPTMIKAYRAGIPDNGKRFPDGSKIAKLEWAQKKITDALRVREYARHDGGYSEGG
jgi:hypothetical protein